MNYEKEMKDLLGTEIYNKFLQAVDEGRISLKQMNDIAAELGSLVMGSSSWSRRAQLSSLIDFQRERFSLIGFNMIWEKWILTVI